MLHICDVPIFKNHSGLKGHGLQKQHRPAGPIQFLFEDCFRATQWPILYSYRPEPPRCRSPIVVSWEYSDADQSLDLWATVLDACYGFEVGVPTEAFCFGRADDAFDCCKYVATR